MNLLILYTLSLVSFCTSYHHGRYSSGPRRSPCAATIFPPDPDSGCCGVDTTNVNMILGGERTALRQYPWLALIEYRNKRDGSFSDECDGFLISAVYVMTAAHCVAGAVVKDSKPVSVRLGEYDKSNSLRDRDCIYKNKRRVDCTTGAVRFPIESFEAHPQYKPKIQKNDIALIKLEKRVYYTESIRPICLPTSDISINPPPRLELVVAGWGVKKQLHYSDGGRDDIDTYIKRHVTVPYKTVEQCKKSWGKAVVSEKQICAGGDGKKGTCMGDSGGPLMYDNNGIYQAVGIVSFGSGERCAKLDTPDVYTKIFAYKDWIDSVMDRKKQEYSATKGHHKYRG